MLNFIQIKTRIVHPPKDPIWDILDSLSLQEGDIVFITSKILAIHQGRCVPVKGNNKQDLIKQEASHWTPYTNRGGFHVNLTITDNILIPSAGIDESNAEGHYILWPKNTDKLCREIRKYLMDKFQLENLGVISTDSHTTPLRWGVTGITTGFAGVKPLLDIRGTPDIFGYKMQVTQVNLIDPLTSMAVLLMGEGAEQTPIVILRDYAGLQFCEKSSMADMKISPDIDLYQPMLDVLHPI
ncbi:MAG: coenzyme F420-0:L-glutamate ligase [Firmicutes bacterium]|nr:coenzyme F420-0:L-glutamate ligase [Bacillota bacterium]